MAGTWTHLPVTATVIEDDLKTSTPSLEQSDIETVTATSLLSSTQGIDSLPPTSTTPSVDTDSQFDKGWIDTPTPFMTTDASHGTSTPLYKTRADESFTDQQSFGGSPIITSSVLSATVSEIITENAVSTPTPTTPNTPSPYDQFKLGLIITLSIVIGCFTITAISLRIRSRIKKRRLEMEIVKKRKKNSGGNVADSKPPVKRVTIKMHTETDSNTRRTDKRPLRRSHSPSLQSKAKIPIGKDMDRNRTLDALLDSGISIPVAQPTLGVARNRSKSSVSYRTGLIQRGKRFEEEEEEHAYDNPVISSVEELTTEVSVLSEETCPPSRMKIDADVHRSQLGAVTHNASDSEDGSMEKGNFIESSETESLSDARKRFKFNHYFGMRSTQRNDSRDSGYVESFISQDSLRLRAMASLEEGRALADGMTVPSGQQRIILPRLASIEPTLLTASLDETSNLNLNRSSSVKSDNDGLSKPKVYRDNNIMKIRQSRYSVPSFPTQYQQCFPHNRQPNRSPHHEMYGAPYSMSYQPIMPRYQSSECSAFDYASTQSDFGPAPRRSSCANRILPKSISCETAMYQSGDLSQQHKTKIQNYAHQKRIKRFVKHRSLGTQTGDDLEDVTPVVRWDYDGRGSLVAKPRENTGIDFIGPIYMAEELDDISPGESQCVINMDSTTSTTSL